MIGNLHFRLFLDTNFGEFGSQDLKNSKAIMTFFFRYIPKINIEPENDGLEDDFPFTGSMLIFRGVFPVVS